MTCIVLLIYIVTFVMRYARHALLCYVMLRMGFCIDLC